MIAGKNLPDYSNLSSPKDCKKNDKTIAKENAGLEFRLKTLVETRHFLVGEIKHSGLMSKKHKKTSRN